MKAVRCLVNLATQSSTDVYTLSLMDYALALHGMEEYTLTSYYIRDRLQAKAISQGQSHVVYFTALHGRCGLAMRILSVKRVNCDKTEERYMCRFLYYTKDHLA